MSPKNLSFISLLLCLLFLSSAAAEDLIDDYPFLPTSPFPFPLGRGEGGQWTLLKKSIGISAMHMQLLHDNRLVIFDRTDTGPSNLSLPHANCLRLFALGHGGGVDCTAHSLLYHVPSNTFRPLTVRTDTWCSSGSVVPNGTLFQTGGYRLGERVVRTFTPCSEFACDWSELPNNLAVRRWYASNQVLPDDRIIVVGGRGAPNYEFFPKDVRAGPRAAAAFRLRFLKETSDGHHHENNLYPFLHLLPDGNLFVFANNRSILLDYNRHRVVREFPVMPGGGDRRSYPLTGSSVILPIDVSKTAEMPLIEVLICGGGRIGAFEEARRHRNKVYVAASRTCGRMRVTDPDPQWAMEEMPMPRVMGDMVMLPTGDVLIINGAGRGTAGWDNAASPVLSPVLYKSHEPDPARRFVIMSPTGIPRMYHSTAVLVPDGRVLVGGSNPNQYYNFTGVRFPTELSLEAYAPHYLDPRLAAYRPRIRDVRREVVNGEVFGVTYEMTATRGDGVTVTMLMPPFTTHSFGMNQRLLVLGVERLDRVGDGSHRVTVRAPKNLNVAPPGYYVLFVVNGGVPSPGVWVHLRPN